ncbi:acetyl-CoA C-acetyltransferase [Polaromonas sp. YR568]|uniref:thiolase family protein n=1 Tax=Polaromonas sp. YR568 TaxID=1855301 RepID=UPI0008F36A44|nr:thiolase family protein [Polaromonas sp. YR568]SFU75158.1 acetyl-CoA C-acetyltransferase [Polaromonas sp. YR568]
MQHKGFFSAFQDVWMLDGVRTPMVDYCGAIGHVSPTDLGIKAARAVLQRSGVSAGHVDSVIAGNMAPGDFEQFMLPRHIGLYAGVPVEVPAIMVQRICGTGFELFRQAGEQIQSGAANVALVVGAESMTRNPIAAFEHRTGFKLGAPVGFKDFMWEALKDSAAGIDMIQTAENLAKKYGITREAVDEFASSSFAKAVSAREAGFHAGEIVPVVTEEFALPGYATRGIRLRDKTTEVAQDTHARLSPASVLAKLRAVHAGGVQTGGNSAALVDAAAAAVVASGAYVKAQGGKPLARVAAAAVVGVPPEIMGIGPAPAIRLLLERCGLTLEQIGRFEINEAQGAQTLAVARELDLDLRKLNVNGGAIAMGHPLAVTGVRLTITAAREMRRAGVRYGIASACVGGGQGIALLLENPEAA